MPLAPQHGELGRFLVGDVADDLAEAAQRARLVAQRGDRDVRQELRPVLAQAPALLLHAAELARPAQVHRRLARGLILGRVEHGAITADDVGLGPALDPLGTAVPDRDPPVRIEHVDGIGRRAVDQQAQFLGQGGVERRRGLPWARRRRHAARTSADRAATNGMAQFAFRDGGVRDVDDRVVPGRENGRRIIHRPDDRRKRPSRRRRGPRRAGLHDGLHPVSVSAGGRPVRVSRPPDKKRAARSIARPLQSSRDMDQACATLALMLPFTPAGKKPPLVAAALFR